MQTPEKTKKPIYFGWYVCAATMFIGFVVIGARNAFGVFVISMSEEFEWDRLVPAVYGSGL